MLLKMAWRNIWRKKKRSLLTMTALAAGVVGIVFIHSFGEGVWGTVIKMTTSAFLGHLQVRSNGWEDEPAIYKTVPDPEAVEAALKMARRAASLPPNGVRLCKAAINAHANALNSTSSHADMDQFALTHKSEDCAEGLRAFMEKRDPIFTGR